jgi:hypothetical protein
MLSASWARIADPRGCSPFFDLIARQSMALCQTFIGQTLCHVPKLIGGLSSEPAIVVQAPILNIGTVDISIDEVAVSAGVLRRSVGLVGVK